MDKEIILKKAVVGGFDRVQVMNCIASLEEKANDAKNDAEELKKLQTTLAELEKVLSDKDAEIESLSANVAEAESKTRVSRASAQLMKDSVDYADRYVESAKILAQDINEKTSLKVKEAKEKIDTILNEITGLSEDIHKLYADLSELKDEYDSFSDSYPAEQHKKNDVEREAVAENSSDKHTVTKTESKKRDESEALELIRKAKEKYIKML